VLLEEQMLEVLYSLRGGEEVHAHELRLRGGEEVHAHELRHARTCRTLLKVGLARTHLCCLERNV